MFQHIDTKYNLPEAVELCTRLKQLAIQGNKPYEWLDRLTLEYNEEDVLVLHKDMSQYDLNDLSTDRVQGRISLDFSSLHTVSPIRTLNQLEKQAGVKVIRFIPFNITNGNTQLLRVLSQELAIYTNKIVELWSPNYINADSTIKDGIILRCSPDGYTIYVGTYSRNWLS